MDGAGGTLYSAIGFRNRDFFCKSIKMNDGQRHFALRHLENCSVP